MDLFKGIKVLSVSEESLIGARGYRLYKYNIETKKWKYYAKVCDNKYSFLSNFSLCRRFFRAEITGLYNLSDGTQLCIAKKGIFRKENKSPNFYKCFSVPRGSRPLNICMDTNSTVYFGEYFANLGKGEVHIYCSKDFGEKWEIAYTFSQGEINHIHGIFNDPYAKLIWVVTGDRENECIIANTANGFKTLNIVFRGSQEYRTCHLLFYPDYIVFATDSQYIRNEIKMFERKSLKICNLQEIQGSVIKGGQCGNISFLSTTVEPSDVNKDRYSHLLISHDGLNWEELYSDEKDRLPILFQFGSIEFPNYYIDPQNFRSIYFSGRALKHTGGNSAKINLNSI